MKYIVAERIVQKGMSHIKLRFSYDAELIKITKKLPDPLWSSQMKCWHIQELSGHKSSKTTEIYTHVTTKGIQKIRSPFDDL